MNFRSFLILILFSPFITIAQAPIAGQRNFQALHYLSQEEMDMPVTTNINFVETPPPVGPVRMVAEFEPAQGVLIRYPFGIPYSLIREMAAGTQVITLVANQSQANTVLGLYQQNNVNTLNCSFLIAPTNSYWTRDYGPWFVFDGNNQPGIVDFPYNRPRPDDNNVPPVVANYMGINLFGMNVKHTGGNMMADGLGIGASTDLVWEENTNLTQAQIRQKYLDYLGISRYDVLPDPLGDYIKHIDCWGKYLAPDKVLIGMVPTSDPRYNAFEAVANFFATTPSSWGYPYKVYRVMTPGGNLITPYTNSLILNNKVFVPTAGNQYDAQAIQVYQQAMPGYQIIPIQYNNWANTDALHCRTHEIADKGMLFVDHRPRYGTLPWQDSVAIAARIVPYSGQSVIPDSLYIRYTINNTGSYTALLRPGIGDMYTGYIKNYSSFDTIRYYLSAADASGRRIKHPYMGALDPHQFVMSEQLFAHLLIEPDTLIWDQFEPYKTVKIINRTGANVQVTSVVNNFTFTFLEGPVAPVMLAHHDSLLINVHLNVPVSSANPPGYYTGTIDINSTNGNYQVTIKVNQDLLQSTDSRSIAAVRAYPNPFSHAVNFALIGFTESAQIQVFDLRGQVVHQAEILNPTAGSTYQWHPAKSALPAGVYMYRISSSQGVFTGRIVRQ
ncbi:MAG TPA: agmatine deiminase family protein [Bacteroidales bacterium]|nr:agmatine deiminase family protein [Bacteroidales bacterium]